ncbi:MAG: NemA protein [Neisseria sp.]|nr:NemA protein [Neisseria sp.]
MKKTLAAGLLGSFLLAACSVGTPGVSLNLGLGGNIGRHVGLGTSVNIPLTLDKAKAAGESQTPITGEQILTYFDAKGQTADQAVKGGFVRKLISKRGRGTYIVQDFYDNGQKRTDPMEIGKADLFVFDARPHNGSMTVYAYNGSVLKQQVFRNGKPVAAQY